MQLTQGVFNKPLNKNRIDNRCHIMLIKGHYENKR